MIKKLIFLMLLGIMSFSACDGSGVTEDCDDATSVCPDDDDEEEESEAGE